MTTEETINGVSYRIYYPDGVDPNNIDANTQVTLYMHGGGNIDAGSDSAVEYLVESGNTDSIVIIPNASNRSTESYYNNVVDVYDSFITENGLNQNNIVISGYSSGYHSTFGVLDTYLEKHPDSDPASVYLVETHPQGWTDKYNYNYDAYKENGTMFYSYTAKYGKTKYTEGNYSSYGVTYSDILNPLTNNGCNVINILESRVVSHQGAEKVFFEDGIIDFSKGSVRLSDDKYTYQVYDTNTGLWVDIDVNDVDTLSKLYQYFGITKLPYSESDTYLINLEYLSSLSLNSETVSTDSDVFLTHIGSVYSAIKNSTFVSGRYVSGCSSSSTTQVPSSIPEVINNYFTTTSSILCRLGSFMKKCEGSNTILEDAESTIKDDAGNLNNGTDSPTRLKYSPTSGDDDDEIKNSGTGFDDLYSTDDKIVLGYNDEYRVIIHKEGNTITGLEYLYSFENSESAASSLLKMKSLFNGSDIKSISRDSSYVSVVFNENTYNGMSIDDLISKFSNLEEIIKE